MRSSLVGSRSIDQSSTWAAETVRLADGWLARALRFWGSTIVQWPLRTAVAYQPDVLTPHF
jgi:hypothetical protein